jgi:hypothetical protein
MTPHLQLFVFVKGLGTSFPVTIERSETVDDLKEAILKKNPNALKDVDSRELTLYQVALPDGEELEQLASQAEKTKLTMPSRELSEIFPENPQTETVSILVEVPNIGKCERVPVTERC